MKKLLLSLLLLLAMTAGSNAQNWSATLRQSDGLPGVEMDYLGAKYYSYTSPVMSPGASTRKIRITVTGTISGEQPNGNNYCFSLSELKVFDTNGNEVPYTASSNADHNSMAYFEDGDGLPGLSDDDYKTYFHSMWYQNLPVEDYHYIDLDLATSVSSFSLQWATRLGEPKNSPTEVGVTLGTEYVPQEIGSDFVLGDAVTTTEQLATGNQLFVLRSNSVKYFTASDGITYTGSGPIYMLYAEEGDVAPKAAHAMQLIPVGDGSYLVYWPVAGRYLANSSAIFNGANGWQYSTNIFANAAYVRIAAVNGGHFEMQYDGANSAGPVTLYVGAELRDGVDSKMKTFDLVHKQALEVGDYTQGFALPVAFNWSVYKAEFSETTLNQLLLTVPKLAQNCLASIISKANSNLGKYGNHDGYCTAGEDNTLRTAISDVEKRIPSMSTIMDITSAEISIFQALSMYMAAGLSKYETEINALLANSSFSNAPYVAGTYPESSRVILTGALSTIASAKEKAGTYSADQYTTIYSQLEHNIQQFLETKVLESGGGNGGNEGGGTPEVDPDDEEVVYVYLKNGNVDAYQLTSLDGNYYEENGKLYIPIKDAGVTYYTKEEYDSCSSVMPELPTMTSFKFNNKYNPNLNVDAIADTVSQDMQFSLNAIGKWLTASFQLSDDRAVAFVDTTLQVSKVTRQSFASKVTYKVTYPGYNIIKRIKVQDEIWTEPVVSGEAVEVQLTADMLSTNKPSQQSDEGLGNLLDGSASTIFHSTWGSANDNTVNVDTYISIALPESLENIQLYYKCRPQHGYNPLVWEVYASKDGNNWTYVRTLDYMNDNMPTGGYGQEYTSPTIQLGDSYPYIRIVQTSGEYAKNHLVLSELRVYKVVTGETKEPEKIQDAVYENRRVPFGRTYNVNVEWLTDKIASVPRIDIDIEGGRFVTSKSTYLDAKFRISGNGVYENFEDSVQIKGRGNSSWSYEKKPYRLKFAEKVKPFGLTKGKSWVLLANAQSGSLMANAIAMKIGQMAGAKYVNHIIPVELYMNGQYMGSYMFTEKVGMANNSVDIDENSGYLIELDTYGSSDEPITRTGIYYLPVKVSEPDLDELATDIAAERKNRIIADCKAMQNAINNNSGLDEVLDIDATARFFLTNDLALNQEINHPKSTFYHKDESDPDGKIAFGPLWDFDWGFDYENRSSYCYTGTTSSVIKTSMAAYTFWQDMTSNKVFKKYYYKVWQEFLENNSIEELKEYIDSYYNFAKSSFQNNAYRWGYSSGFSEDDRDRAKQWVEDRAEFIRKNLTEYDIDDLLHTLKGDVNCNDVLTVHDVALVAAYLNGETHKAFNATKADVDGNGKIEIADAEAAASLVLDSDAPSSMYWYSTPEGEGVFAANDFEIELGAEQNIPLVLSSSDSEPYSAIQFDITVPDGFDIYDVTAGEDLTACQLTFSQKDMTRFRVVAYIEDKTEFGAGDAVVANLTVSASSVIEEDARKLTISNIYAVADNGNDEVRLEDSTLSFSQSTSVGSGFATFAVKGGEEITITSLETMEIAVYSVDGRLVRKVNAKEGTTHISVPAGMYIVNGEKVTVY